MAAARPTQETYHEVVILFIFRLTSHIIKLFRFNYVIIIITIIIYTLLAFINLRNF